MAGVAPQLDLPHAFHRLRIEVTGFMEAFYRVPKRLPIVESWIRIVDDLGKSKLQALETLCFEVDRSHLPADFQGLCRGALSSLYMFLGRLRRTAGVSFREIRGNPDYRFLRDLVGAFGAHGKPGEWEAIIAHLRSRGHSLGSLALWVGVSAAGGLLASKWLRNPADSLSMGDGRPL